MKLYVSVPAHNPEFNYAAVAAAADGVVIMNYDEHYPNAPSGPVASQDWFVENLKFAESAIPREKLICAIANYGYDWVLKPKNGKMPPGEHDSYRLGAGGLVGGPRFGRRMSLSMMMRSTPISVTSTSAASATTCGFSTPSPP